MSTLRRDRISVRVLPRLLKPTASAISDAIAERIATQPQAEVGAVNDKLMTPLRTRQAIDSRALVFQSRNAAAAATIPIDITSIRTLGYAAAGDGGGAVYRATTAAEPGSFLSNAGSRHWALAETQTVSALCFGLVIGDASGANAAANNVAIAAALAYPRAKHITFPVGAIEISETLNLSRNNDAISGVAAAPVFGDAYPWEGTVFRWYGPASDAVVAMYSTTDFDVQSPSISGIAIDCRNNATYGLRVGAVQKPKVDHVHVFNMNSGIAFAFGYSNAIFGTNCTYQGSFNNLTAFVDESAIGLFCDNDPSGVGQNVTFCTFTNLHITHKDGFAIYLRGMDDCLFDVVGISRRAGGLGEAILIDGPSPNRFVVGNTFNTVNCSVTDGPAPRIVSQGSGARQNVFLHVTGVDHRPVFNIAPESELHYYFSGSGYSGILSDEQPLLRCPPLRITSYENSDPRVLDWYQEYTFVPELQVGGSPAGITYEARGGHYTRIGNRISGSLSLKLTSKGSGSGALTIAGMPWFAIDVGSFNLRAVTGFTSGVIDRPLGALRSGTSFILLKTLAGAGGMSPLEADDITNTASLVLDFAFSVPS